MMRFRAAGSSSVVARLHSSAIRSFGSKTRRPLTVALVQHDALARIVR
jgi:hypothetical protein